MDSKTINQLKRRLGLLTIANSKLRRSDNTTYFIAGLHLLPHILSGRNTCPFHSFECAATCLNFSGNGFYPKVQQARLKRTNYWFNNRSAFLTDLHSDLWLLNHITTHHNLKLAVRLNLTSDILWERYDVPQAWPTIQFYDYTKVPARRGIPSNYHLTFSFSGHNLDACKLALRNHINVAVPFRCRPATWLNYPTIDGDTHDLRFLDPTPRVVALAPKGRLRRYHASPFLGDNHASQVIQLQGL